MVESLTVKAPVPGHEVDAVLGLVSSQDRSVEFGQRPEVTGRPLGFQRGRLFYQSHIFPYHAGEIRGLLAGSFPFQGIYIFVSVPDAGTVADFAQGKTHPFHREQTVPLRLCRDAANFVYSIGRKIAPFLKVVASKRALHSFSLASC